jgi:hypothetical protein
LLRVIEIWMKFMPFFWGYVLHPNTNVMKHFYKCKMFG